jgi:hypothetical protein
MKTISRLGIYRALDAMPTPVDEWLEAKRLLDYEFLAAETNAVLSDKSERGDDDIDEYLDRKFS